MSKMSIQGLYMATLSRWEDVKQLKHWDHLNWNCLYKGSLIVFNCLYVLKDCCLLGCDALSIGMQFLDFRRIESPFSSWIVGQWRIYRI